MTRRAPPRRSSQDSVAHGAAAGWVLPLRPRQRRRRISGWATNGKGGPPRNGSSPTASRSPTACGSTVGHRAAGARGPVYLTRGRRSDAAGAASTALEPPRAWRASPPRNPFGATGQWRLEATRRRLDGRPPRSWPPPTTTGPGGRRSRARAVAAELRPHWSDELRRRCGPPLERREGRPAPTTSRRASAPRASSVPLQQEVSRAGGQRAEGAGLRRSSVAAASSRSTRRRNVRGGRRAGSSATRTTLIPEGGDVMVYGDGGAGKTTLCLDLACHLAAGDDWLGIPVAAAVACCSSRTRPSAAVPRASSAQARRLGRLAARRPRPHRRGAVGDVHLRRRDRAAASSPATIPSTRSTSSSSARSPARHERRRHAAGGPRVPRASSTTSAAARGRRRRSCSSTTRTRAARSPAPGRAPATRCSTSSSRATGDSASTSRRPAGRASGTRPTLQLAWADGERFEVEEKARARRRRRSPSGSSTRSAPNSQWH